jgi:putative ABC transport system permease protein
VRTTIEPTAVVGDLRRTIESAAPGVAVASVAPFASFLDAPLAGPRLNATLLAVFAGAAVALAAIGLFGVMATMVRSRTRELGVRMALGATAGDLRRMVLRRGLAIAAVGAALGVGGALAANRLLEALLYEVRPTDAPTLALVTVALLAVAALAALLPARASTRIDPTVALRAEE